MIDRRIVQGVALAACASLLVACGNGSGSPTAPSGAGPWTGVWQGTLTDSTGSAGTLRLTLEERAIDARRALVSGEWTASFADTSRNGTGTVGGTITDAIGTLLLTPATPLPCPQPLAGAAGSYSLPALTRAGPSIQGAYSQLLCTSTRTGTLALTKP